MITDIYANYFFVTPAIPMGYQIRLNGTLSDEWCVGEPVICTDDNINYDEVNQRVEVDYLTIEQSDWEQEPSMDYKPGIYLYPEEETEVSVTLNYSGTLACTYPACNNGWTVTASPGGTLTDEGGKTYNYF